MIDWVTARLRCTHDSSKLFGGLVVSMNAKGEVEWQTEKRVVVEGSYSKNITVRSHTDGVIEISGNPAKFLQGHNVFGSDDLIHLITKTLDRLIALDIGLTPTQEELQKIAKGFFAVTRVDVNEHFAFNSEKSAKAYLRAIANSSNMRHRGAGQFRGDTLYFSPQSRRMVAKIYHKGDEIHSRKKEHRLHDDFLAIPELVSYATNSLRLELKILSTQLKDWELNFGYNWTLETPFYLLKKHFIDKLELSENMPIQDDVLETLPSKLRLVYSAWSSGEDLKRVLPETTFRRHRKALQQYGIDIAIVQDSKPKENIIPMISYLVVTPMGIPSWAYEKGLVA